MYKSILAQMAKGWQNSKDGDLHEKMVWLCFEKTMNTYYECEACGSQKLVPGDRAGEVKCGRCGHAYPKTKA